MTLLPLDFPPLRAEAKRLAREAHDATVAAIKAKASGQFKQDLLDALPPKWVDVDAQARLLANPALRDSQAWMAEWLAGQLHSTPAWLVMEVAGYAERSRLTPVEQNRLDSLYLLCHVDYEQAQAARTVGDALVTCVLSLGSRVAG